MKSEENDLGLRSEKGWKGLVAAKTIGSLAGGLMAFWAGICWSRNAPREPSPP